MTVPGPSRGICAFDRHSAPTSRALGTRTGVWRALVTSDSISSPPSFPLFRARYTSSAARCPSRPWTPLPTDNSANDADLPPAVSLRPLLDVCVTDKRGREEESPKGGGQASGGVGALTAAQMRAGGSE